MAWLCSVTCMTFRAHNCQVWATVENNNIPDAEQSKQQILQQSKGWGVGRAIVRGGGITGKCDEAYLALGFTYSKGIGSTRWAVQIADKQYPTFLIFSGSIHNSYFKKLHLFQMTTLMSGLVCESVWRLCLSKWGTVTACVYVSMHAWINGSIKLLLDFLGINICQFC